MNISRVDRTVGTVGTVKGRETHRMKQYPTSHAITGTVMRNQRDIQVCVFTAILAGG